MPEPAPVEMPPPGMERRMKYAFVATLRVMVVLESVLPRREAYVCLGSTKKRCWMRDSIRKV